MGPLGGPAEKGEGSLGTKRSARWGNKSLSRSQFPDRQVVGHLKDKLTNDYACVSRSQSKMAVRRFPLNNFKQWIT